MPIVVGTNSWVTEAEADTYLGDRIGAEDYWVSGADKEGSLVTAYRWLMANPNLSLPTTATQAMKDAQCEYALFLTQHQPDIDLRMGLQAQGVTEAGVVKEKYRVKSQVGLPLPPAVAALLDTLRQNNGFHMGDLERDEEQETGYDAVGNLERDTT